MRYMSMLTFLLVALLSCETSISNNREKSEPTDPFSKIQDQSARDLLQMAIEASGGLGNWQEIQQLSFNKSTILFRSDSTIENQVDQNHVYQFYPAPAVHINWEKDGDSLQILSNQNGVARMINGQPDPTANDTSLRNSVLSATFVISIPYKLLDEGVSLSYEGVDTLENGQIVEVLKAVYQPEKFTHHSTPDIWWHFFDQNSKLELAYMVKHADHYSYVLNTALTETDGFTFPSARESFRVDSLRSVLYLRATYQYDNYKIRRHR